MCNRLLSHPFDPAISYFQKETILAIFKRTFAPHVLGGHRFGRPHKTLQGIASLRAAHGLTLAIEGLTQKNSPYVNAGKNLN